MTKVLGEFVKALREADVRISPAEVIDAEAVLGLVGYEDRLLLGQSLAVALAKSSDDKEAFWSTFERYFAFDQFRDRPDPVSAESREQAEARERSRPDDETPPDEMGVSGMASSGGSGDGSGKASGQGDNQGGTQQGQAQGERPAGSSAAEEDLASLLERGDRVELQVRLAEAAQQAGLSDIRFFTQRGLYQWRILQLMGAEDLSRTIEALQASGDAGGQARGRRLRALRERLHDEVRQYVEVQLELFAGNEGRRLREDVLASQRIGYLDRSDMRIMQGLVRKMAKRLVSLHARRKREARRGQLDARRTIRANMQFEGVPFYTIWKRTKVDRPRVMVLCDVSGSVAQVSSFLLMFLHSLHEVLPQVRSFAFSSNLGEVTELFEELPIEVAMGRTMQRYGGSTDYGRALSDFEKLALEDIDRRTTVLILGDARSNYGDPRADILHSVHDRAKRVLFLNPEHRNRWGTGDSEMLRYAPYCDRTISCASLRDLERVVTDIVRTAV